MRLRFTFAVRAVVVFGTTALIDAPPGSAGEPFGHIVPLREHTSGQLYVEGVLSGSVETEFLVDTGSGYVALSRTTFDTLRRNAPVEHVRDIYGEMANGKLLKVPVYRIGELSIGAACRLTDVEVVVLPSGARDILGVSALKRLEPFALEFSPPQLWVTDCEIHT